MGRNGPSAASHKCARPLFPVLMIFNWLKRRRRQALRAAPLPARWVDVLDEHVGHYAFLGGEERSKLHDDLRILIAEKNWEGCGGLELNDTIRVTVAGQAALLLLGFEDEYYDHVQSILVYPAGFLVPTQEHDEAGVVHQREDARLGEAWQRGPVILSWADAQYGGRDAEDGTNVVLHEFAHQLDMAERAADGTPLLRSREQYRRWREVMTREYRHLVRASARGTATLLDQYGAKDEAEFFAVATETFFEWPRELRQEHPELYDLLKEYYQQDPARRLRTGRSMT